MNIADFTDEAIGSILTTSLVSLVIYVRGQRDRRALKVQKRKLASLMTLQIESMIGARLLPERFRAVNIQNEPTHGREKLMERLALISRGISYAEHDFLFVVINRIYQSRQDILNFDRATVFRLYRILYFSDMASVVWGEIRSKRS